MIDPESAMQPFYFKKLPLVQLIGFERKEAIDRLYDSYHHSIAHWHQVMVLAAGIAGVVIPVLYSQRPMMINPWFLRRAVVCFGLCVLDGVLCLWVGRWLMVYVAVQIQSHYTFQANGLGAAETEVEAGEALAAASEQWASRSKGLMRFVLALGLFGEVIFYGPFLWGLAYLIRGVARP